MCLTQASFPQRSPPSSRWFAMMDRARSIHFQPHLQPNDHQDLCHHHRRWHPFLLLISIQLLVDLGQSVYSVGVLFGVLLPGFLSDRWNCHLVIFIPPSRRLSKFCGSGFAKNTKILRYGRKKMMFLSMAIEAIATLSSAYVRSYSLFLATRFQHYHTFVHLREPVECYVAESLCKGGGNTPQLHNVFFSRKILHFIQCKRFVFI